MSALSDILGLAEVFEYAETAELFVLTGDTVETAKVTNVADLTVGEREAVEARAAAEGVMSFDREDLEAVGMAIEAD